jgi:hypothetical protein
LAWDTLNNASRSGTTGGDVMANGHRDSKKGYGEYLRRELKKQGRGFRREFGKQLSGFGDEFFGQLFGLGRRPRGKHW